MQEFHREQKKFHKKNIGNMKIPPFQRGCKLFTLSDFTPVTILYPEYHGLSVTAQKIFIPSSSKWLWNQIPHTGYGSITPG
jgi:hypothetical protein